MVRNVLGSLIALAGAAVAVWSPFRAWYNGRLGRAVRIEDVFEGLTRSRAELFGSLLLPMLVGAVLTLLGVLLRSKAVVTLAGLVVLAVTVLWMVRQGQTAGGLSVGTAGRGLGPGVGAAVGGGALLLLGALVMRGRRGGRRRGRARREAYERYDEERYGDEGYGAGRYAGHEPYGGQYGDERYGYGPHEGYGAHEGYRGHEGYGPPAGHPYGRDEGARSDAPTPPQPWGPVAPPPSGGPPEGPPGGPPDGGGPGERAPGPGGARAAHPSDFEDTQANLPPIDPNRPPPPHEHPSAPGPTTAPPPLPPRAGTGATAAEPPRSGRGGPQQRLWWGSAHGDDATPTGGAGPDHDPPGARPGGPPSGGDAQHEPEAPAAAPAPDSGERRARGEERNGSDAQAGPGARAERTGPGEAADEPEGRAAQDERGAREGREER